MSHNAGLIALIEAGSGYDPEKPFDPGLMRYRTSIYPNEAGVDLLIRDIEEFRSLANHAEPRLRPYLLDIVYAMDCALAGKSSEGGKMLELITTMKSQQAVFSNVGGGASKDPDGLEKLNEVFGEMTSPHQNTDFGNKKYQ